MPTTDKFHVRLVMAIAVVLIGTIVTVAYHLASSPQLVQLAVPAADAHKISFFALGDQGSGQFRQWTVARSMDQVAARTGDLDFVVLLGDSFYGNGVESVGDKQWNWKFENVYSGKNLAAIPFYAVLGNHDVQGNAEAQIQYSRERAGSGRWQMPGRFYSRDFGTDDGHPLLRIVFIDTNRLTPESLDQQAHFVEQAFAASGGRPTWRVVVAHHPIRNFGKHGETPQLVSALLPVLQKAHVDLYLTGHDHDQQLIARDGEPYYVISGGGGQGLYRVAREQEGLVFGESQHGFARIVVDPARMTIGFYAEGAELAGRYAVNRNCTGSAVGCLHRISEPTNARN